ncbi:class I SAM-dependent methyltransferase [Pseudomonas aeruginosa]|uniref:class I SAM-dependent methyltransferase n=1 Tax=Pseudomonas aeruginosa TaxID=287 RepID=UPI0007726503|nr:class I SAM-dependent methyltransferase [Pseudomonas aeruginosa]KWX33047.1 methylase [Pseudomonas aeruginosa]
MTDLEHAVESNRRAWDASADSHLRGSGWQELSLAVQETGFSCLDETLAGVLRNLDLAGKAAVQVGCNNGREVLSLYAFGVARAVGIDQSAAFLAQARQLAERSPHQPRFVEANAYELPAELNGQFDLLLITIGVLNWMPDIARFFASVGGLLKPGGQLAIYETHPFLEMLEPESERPFELRNDYFTDTPHVSREAIVYEGSGSDTGIASYWYVHPLGDILGGLLGAGLRLSHFKEYPHSNREELYDLYEDGPLAIPMCYTLVAVKA